MSCLKSGHKFMVILLGSWGTKTTLWKRRANNFIAMILGALANCQIHKKEIPMLCSLAAQPFQNTSLNILNILNFRIFPIPLTAR